jgi:hypothetical protein
MDFRRTVKCANCSSEASFNVSSDLELKEIAIAGRCRCGSTLQVTYSLVLPSGANVPEPPKAPEQPAAAEGMVNLDESIFGGDIPSDTLRDLMEE